MQFRALLAVAVLATGVFANQHFRMVCKKDGRFDEETTLHSCQEYVFRYTGPDKHDSCADCAFFSPKTPGDIPYCESKGWHLGGEQFEEYCTHFGADFALDLDLSFSPPS